MGRLTVLTQRLRHSVTIQQQIPTTAASGEPIGFAWQNLHEEVPAEMVPLSGRELMAAAAEQAEIRTRCTLRWMDGLDTTMRIVHEGLGHNILAILPDPTYRQHLTLMLSEGLRDEPVQTVTIIDGGAPGSAFDDLVDGGAP